MTAADWFSIFCVILTLAFFLARAFFVRFVSDKANAFEDYLLASRQLTTREIRWSMAATYSAFATVLFWFITLGASYSWLLALIPISLVLGNVVFIRAVTKYGLIPGKFDTIGSYIRSMNSYGPLSFIVDVVVFISLFSALIVEVVIGSSLLSAMMPGIPGGEGFFVVLISLLVIAYVVTGGYRAVILSDTVQLLLTFLGVCALLAFALFYVTVTSTAPSLNYLYTPSVNILSLMAFLVSVLAVQFLGPLCQLNNWQRISAAKEHADGLKGHYQGAVIGGILWFLMIICAIILYTKAGRNMGFNQIFDSMKQGGVLSEFALYPLVFVGLVAAMISTADSAMSGIYLFIYDISRRRMKRKGQTFNPSFKHNALVGAVLFVAIVVLYILNQTNMKSFAIAVIYFLFNQLIVVFPILFYFLMETEARRNEKLREILIANERQNGRFLSMGAALGWLTVFGMSATGYVYGLRGEFATSLNWIMFASCSGVAVACLFSAGCFARLAQLSRKFKEERRP